MQFKFLDSVIAYDGSQLRPRFACQNHSVIGNSVVGFIGPCSVSFQHMKDLEDLNSGSQICGDLMLHFICELFDTSVMAAIGLQRLIASIVKDEIENTVKNVRLIRRGDDLYWNDQKLSISIACPSIGSSLIHFAVNINNSGTPVKTCSLQDFAVEPKPFAEKILKKIVDEWASMENAKVKALPSL